MRRTGKEDLWLFNFRILSFIFQHESLNIFSINMKLLPFFFPIPGRSHYVQSLKASQAGVGSLTTSSSGENRSHASIFLRIGAVLFGLGVMIHNGLEFGAFFEISENASCYSILLGLNPILQAAFTFAQMYFIFTYSRMNHFRFVARFGLMHLVATNICVWIRTLGKETLHVSSPAVFSLFIVFSFP